MYRPKQDKYAYMQMFMSLSGKSLHCIVMTSATLITNHACDVIKWQNFNNCVLVKLLFMHTDNGN